MNTTLAKLEIACGLAWFFDDGMWLMQWRWPCYIACVIAMIFGLLIQFKTPKRPVPQIMCLADNGWLLCNVLWSIGDLENINAGILAAKIAFFWACLCFILAFTVSDAKRTVFDLVLRRLRLLQSLGR